MKYLQAIALILFACLLPACSFSLAGDVTPPPGYEQQPQAPEQAGATPEPASGPPYPLTPVDLQNGEAIYGEKCIQCHGPAGLGDGPQAAQLPNPVAALGDPEVARQASPAGWYTIVTQGNIDRFMPGFRSLSDAERWDVTAYAFTLSTNGELAPAAELYAENCAGCHGETGRGDGPEAAGLSTAPTDFSNPAVMAQKSAEDHYAAITEGVPPDMPAFAGTLSEAERWSLASYVRDLTFTAPTSVAEGEAPAATQDPAEETTPEGEALSTEIAATQEITSSAVTTSTTGSITGQVINASGGEIPTGLVLSLHGFDDVQVVITDTTAIQPDGSFVFEQVEMPAGRAFLVVADYGGASYSSDVAVAEAQDRNLDLPVTIYETTRDPSALSVDRLHLFFEFVDESTVRVIQLYILSNTGDKTVVGEAQGEPVIQFELPQNATNLDFQDGVLGVRYVETEKGFADTVPIRPGSGEYQILFGYNMPYQRRLELSQPVPLPVEAVVILVPEGSMKIRSDKLSDNGVRDVQGTQYHLYSGSSLNAGEELQLTLTGSPGGSRATLPLGPYSSLVIGLAGLGLALVVAGLVLYRRSQNAEVEERIEGAAPEEEDLGPETPDGLMDAILALDDLYASGQLPEEAYLQRRTELKERLKRLMDEQ
jgi:mono/diheme cytochrome c family protein